MSINPTVLNEKLILEVFNVFIEEFNKLKDLSEKDETEMLNKICPSLFRKWFYSALIDDTPLTPANIIKSLSDKYTAFTIQSDYSSQSQGWTLHSVKDTLYDSFFINDIKTLCDTCSPAGEIRFENPNDMYDLSNKLYGIFIKDGYYASYLAIMAQKLGLIQKMPSINTVKYQKNDSAYNDFFALSPIEAHKTLLKTAVEIFIEKTAFQTQAPINVFHVDDIIEIISSSCVTDSIFAYIYSLMGFDFDKIAEIGTQSTLSEDDEALVSSVLYMGILIDKWLITPLGCYMGIISPYYASPYSFFEDYDYLRPVLTADCDLSVELFAPPNYFVLTDKGVDLLGKRQDNYLSYTLNGSLTEDDIKEVINAYRIFLNMLQSSAIKKSKAKNIYSLKVSFKNNADMWKILELDCNSTLESLKNEIVMYFGFSNSKKYSFEYKNNIYAPSSAFKTINSAENVTLYSLGIENGGQMVYSDGFDKSLDLVINSSGILPADAKTVYPRLYRQSHDITQRERSDEF